MVALELGEPIGPGALYSASMAAAETPRPAPLVGNKDESMADYGRVPAPGSIISAIDVVAQRESRKVDVSPMFRPHGITVAGGKVYFTAGTNHATARHVPAANQIGWSMGTGQNTTRMVLAGKNLNFILTANISSDTITAPERAVFSNAVLGNRSTTQIAVGKGPEAIAFTLDENQVWTAHSRDGGVSVMDAATRKAIALIGRKLGGGPYVAVAGENRADRR
jgi:DNA-binding beta-propeller fold protein YncE